MEEDVISDYRRRADLAHEKATENARLANSYSLLRLVVFALLIGAVYAAIVSDNIAILMAAFVILGFCFAWLVSRQGRYDDLKAYFGNVQQVCENEIASMQNRLNIYADGAQFVNEKHFYTADLDIFGSGSLMQLINRAATSPGLAKLSGWLSAPAARVIILSRQQAVKELANKNDWKLDIQARLLFSLKEDTEQLTRLFIYLKLPLNLSGETWLRKYIMAAPFILAVVLVASYFFADARTAVILIGLANVGIVFSKAVYIKKADLIAGKIGDILNRYADVFEKIESEEWQSACAENLAQTIRNDNTSARIGELSRLINKLNYHLNILVGFALNLFFLWDIRQVIAIEDWKHSNQHNLEVAFDVVAEFEALMSLAGLHINYPAWCFAEIAQGQFYTLTAAQIAHPLISTGNRVNNDYELDDRLTIDIITGSNMAGKSTFLRTIGINTVLALCGAPVCAKTMRVSVVTVVSYMRIKDSLNESTSTFKAELDRLQMLLAAVENDAKVFFLIDEMLRGTNSVDKYLGSKAVIEQLIRKRGVGLVATHDLQIAQLEQQYPDYIRNFYFDIQIKDGEMLFDYKMKQGECKTFNASLLLKRIGIG